MKDVCSLIWLALIGLFRSRATLQAEILTLRHQLNVLRRKSPQRLTFTSIDRLVFAGLYRAAPGALDALTELTSFSQKAGFGTGTKTDGVTGEATAFSARYLIAAEGAQSRVRRSLGVQMIGEEKVYDSVNILFNADLRQWTEQRTAALYFVEQPELRGTFLTINGTDRWGFLIHSLSQYGYRPGDFTPERCTALIRQAVGITELAVSVLGVSQRCPQFGC